MDYHEKLKDPRWQRKRLEVMGRDDLVCQFCGRKDREIHVHHKFYKMGCDPWDYPLETLVSLCESCHNMANAWRKEFELVTAKLTIHEQLVLANIIARSEKRGFVRPKSEIFRSEFELFLAEIFVFMKPKPLYRVRFHRGEYVEAEECDCYDV